MKFEIDREKYIDSGLVDEKVHPTAPLILYNYTQKCQFAREWDEVTKMCRGLIVDATTREIVARPFGKFFNYEEHVEKGDAFPDEVPHVYTKFDGSLGILYWVDDLPAIATRGSFTSDQAKWATEYIRQMDLSNLNRNWTYLFEIIYPENRIVVAYGDMQALIFLAAIETNTGKTVQVEGEYLCDGIVCAPRVPFTSYDELKQLNKQNEEGFVLHYLKNDFRVKVKFEDYVRLHKIMTGLSEIGIWEMLKEGKDPLAQKDIPDEMHGWLKGVIDRITGAYAAIEDKAKAQFSGIDMTGVPEVNRKEWAMRIQKMNHPQLGFSMLDGKDYSQVIWRMVRPRGAVTFRKDTDA